jgi:hypothetical protein
LDVTELFEAFAANPPAVHRPGYTSSYDDAQGHFQPVDLAGGTTYYTNPTCYTTMSRHVGAGSVTMETGLGLSTVLFAMLGCDHTAMFLDADEEPPLRQWAASHDVDMSKVKFVVGPSDEGLRAFAGEAVDLFFIDGGHGYPLPQLDWFYGASRLPKGAILVLDDLQLWAPRQLDTFLGLDPRWERVSGDWNWSAHRRLVSGPVAEDFDKQAFLPLHAPPLRKRVRDSISTKLPASIKDPLRRALRSTNHGRDQ